MLKILNQYEQDGYQITEYTKDGTTVSHTVKVPIQTEPVEPVEPRPTTDERLEIIELSVAQTQTQVDYLAFMTELATMKGGEK